MREECLWNYGKNLTGSVKVHHNMPCRQSRNKGIVAVILSLGASREWVVNAMPWLIYPQERALVPSGKRLGGSQYWAGQVLKTENLLLPPGLAY